MALSYRLHEVEPFLNIRFAEDNQYVGFQAGVTTYNTNDNNEETYQTTYSEVGLRSDHLNDAVDQLMNQPVATRLTAEPGDDLVYITPGETKADKQVPALKVA